MRGVIKVLLCSGRLLNVMLLGLVLLLSACSTSVVNKYYTAKGQNSRVRYIILHYTRANLQQALQTLTQGQVSAHYLITDEKPARVFQLVDENRRAWHAGYSQWHDDVDLNSTSIGIEIVNQGPLCDELLSSLCSEKTAEHWQPFSESQTQRLIALLKDIQQRHHISPQHILGHSDVAPSRKIDPGPAFPWQRLAQEGVAVWYDDVFMQQQQRIFVQQGLPSVLSIQRYLKSLGYAIDVTGQWDVQSQEVMRAFQMHYRPSRYDGLPDVETVAILSALVNQSLTSR